MFAAKGELSSNTKLGQQNTTSHMLAKVITSNEPECLVYLIGTACFLAPLVAARFSPRPFLGSLFALALLPFLASAFVSFVRLQAAVSYAESSGRYDPDNLIVRLHEVYAPAYLGLITTGAALALHFALCVLTRHRPNHALQRTESGGTSSLHP